MTDNNQNSNFRMERTFMSKKNMDELREITGNNVAESILHHIYYEHQYNIFGYGKLDPDEFGKRFNYSKRYLAEKVENPYQLRILSTKKQGALKAGNLRNRTETERKNKIYDSTFENALFTLMNYPFGVTVTVKEDANTLTRTYKVIRVIKYFSIVQDKNTGKVIYEYELEEDFRRNLDTLYLKTNINSIIALRKSCLNPLYFFLVSLKDALMAKKSTETTIENTPGFEYLCNLANIKDDIEPKYRKRNLNQCFARINQDTELNVRITWVKNGNNESYTPIIKFILDDNEKQRMNNDRLSNIIRINEKITIAVNELKLNLTRTFPRKDDMGSSHIETDFLEWLRTDDIQHRSIINKALLDTIVNCGYKIPDDMEARITQLCFLAKNNTIEDIDKWLTELFTGRFKLIPTEIKSEDKKN